MTDPEKVFLNWCCFIPEFFAFLVTLSWVTSEGFCSLVHILARSNLQLQTAVKCRIWVVLSLHFFPTKSNSTNWTAILVYIGLSICCLHPYLLHVLWWCLSSWVRMGPHQVMLRWAFSWGKKLVCEYQYIYGMMLAYVEFDRACNHHL